MAALSRSARSRWRSKSSRPAVSSLSVAPLARYRPRYGPVLGQARVDRRRRRRLGGDLVFQALAQTTIGCPAMFDSFFGDEPTTEPGVKAARMIATLFGIAMY